MSSKVITAAILVIGNEILSGRTQDTNSNAIASALSAHGVRLMEIRVVPDIQGRIVEGVNTLRSAYDYVFTTGGIGPTHDDITADSIAAAFGVNIGVRQDAYDILLAHYGQENLTDARLRMARIPDDATLIPNPVSAAPGFILENVYVMAGVPQIMRAMLDNVISVIQGGAPILSGSIACNLPESALASDMEALQNAYPDLEIGSYPYYRNGVQGLSIAVRGVECEVVMRALNEMADILRSRGEEPLVNYP